MSFDGIRCRNRGYRLASFIGLGDFVQNLSVVLFKNRERSFKQLKSSDLSWKCT
jgi:hypothetical protein